MAHYIAQKANLSAKRRPVDNPYEIWEDKVHGFVYRVLKKYQSDDHKDGARWFCQTSSPLGDGSLGDVYVSDIIKDIVRIK